MTEKNIQRQMICPQCRGLLTRVRRSPTSPLNQDQFDSAKAGDYFCPTCPDNGRGHRPLCYWWEHELLPVHDYQI